MIKKLAICSFLLGIFLSCKKNNSENTVSPLQDSLGIGWYKVPIGEENTMVDIQFSDNTGFAVGSNKIFKSIDGGQTWKVVRSTTQSSTEVSMWGENNIIAVGGSNEMYTSLDGGSSFQIISLDDNALNKVFFVGEKSAYAIGTHFWKTSDGGINWQRMYTFPESSTQINRSVHFINAQRGWAIASNESSGAGLYKTEDGGKSWIALDSGYAKYGMAEMFVLYDNVAYLNNQTEFALSGNGGKSWNKVIDNTSSSFRDIYFLTTDYGYISDNKRIYKVTDQGAAISTEVSLNANNNNATIRSLYFTDASHGWACGYNGYILKYVK